MSDFEENGYTIFENIVNADVRKSLESALQSVQCETAHRGGEVFAIRNLFEAVPMISEFARHSSVRDIAQSLLGKDCFAVRGLFFDKNENANWKVPFHQDLTVATHEQRAVEGYGPWTIKAGIPHVQPPISILENMVALRIHLDDTDESNGALRVIPGSHREGRLSAEDILAWKLRTPAVTCAVNAGGVMAMRPLLLHASSPAVSPRHRRVIHLEFACCELAEGLEWHCRI